MSDKVAETLAAVDRGEAPACPFCGAKYIGDAKTTYGKYVWGCATMYGRTQDYYEEDIWLRTETCFNSEIAALREDVSAKAAEITRMYELKQKFIAEIGRLNALVAKLDAKNAELWAAVALAIGEADGKEDA